MARERVPDARYARMICGGCSGALARARLALFCLHKLCSLLLPIYGYIRVFTLFLVSSRCFFQKDVVIDYENLDRFLIRSARARSLTRYTRGERVFV